MKVRVDRDLCRGLGNCVVCAPTVFRLDEENKAVVLDPSSASDNILFDAARGQSPACPQSLSLLRYPQACPITSDLPSNIGPLIEPELSA